MNWKFITLAVLVVLIVALFSCQAADAAERIITIRDHYVMHPDSSSIHIGWWVTDNKGKHYTYGSVFAKRGAHHIEVWKNGPRRLPKGWRFRARVDAGQRWEDGFEERWTTYQTTKSTRGRRIMFELIELSKPENPR